MPKYQRILSIAFAAVMLLLLLIPAACTQERPPDNGTPWPEDLDGEFVSEYGTLRFNGDGKSISFELTEEFAEAVGLPEASGEGTYVFIFRNEQWRYDLAETFRIIVGDKTVSLSNIVGLTSPMQIAVVSPEDPAEGIVFLKKIGE